jgi:hypothetical protein
MTAPATAERTRATAGTTPANLKEAAAPDELKVEGVADATEEVPGVVTAGGVETGIVGVTEGVEKVADDVDTGVETVVAGVEVVDASEAEELLVAPMTKVPGD